jgi:spermidine/putrescine transport system permease protein
MNKKRPLGLTIAAILVYFFLYAPIIVLVLFAFNESRTNVLFTGFVNKGACGPFYWFCQLADNRELMGASKNTLLIAFVSDHLFHHYRHDGSYGPATLSISR